METGSYLTRKEATVNDLRLLAINLTRRCNLACQHCYLDAKTLDEGSEYELTTQEVCDLLDTIATRSQETMVVLTGGEPLLRTDIETIVQCGISNKLFVVVGTNGTLLTDRRVRSLKAAGLMGVGISLDSIKPGQHDEFRGRQGSWQKTFKGLAACRYHDLSFQIHFTVTANTIDQVAEVIEFSHQQGARIVNIFFLICTGRGETLTDISAAQYESVLKDIIKAQANYPDLIIRPRCAPHFKRIAMQMNPQPLVNRISGREGDGCLAGIHYCRITSQGGVTACPFIDAEVGNIRDRSFFEIWDGASQFLELREPNLKGKCGLCEYRFLCGGCRARPYSQGGSLMDSDPWCSFVPRSTTVIAPLGEQPDPHISWDEPAEKRLSRIPGFIRKMVKQRAEAYVADLGERLVTCNHLDALTAKRFGGKKPARPRFIGSRTRV